MRARGALAPAVAATLWVAATLVVASLSHGPVGPLAFALIAALPLGAVGAIGGRARAGSEESGHLSPAARRLRDAAGDVAATAPAAVATAWLACRADAGLGAVDSGPGAIGGAGVLAAAAILCGWAWIGRALARWNGSGEYAALGWLSVAQLGCVAAGLLAGTGEAALGWRHPGVAELAWRLSPLVALLEAMGLDAARHPAFYDLAGTDGFVAMAREPWLAIAAPLVVGFVLALVLRPPRLACPSASTSAPSPRT